MAAPALPQVSPQVSPRVSLRALPRVLSQMFRDVLLPWTLLQIVFRQRDLGESGNGSSRALVGIIVDRVGADANLRDAEGVVHEKLGGDVLFALEEPGLPRLECQPAVLVRLLASPR